MRLESLVGGNQANAIPRTTAVTVAVPEEQVDAFTAYVAAFAATIQHELEMAADNESSFKKGERNSRVG